MSADFADGLTYCSILNALENPTPAEKIRRAALDAAEEADPFIIPLSKSKMLNRPQAESAPVSNLAVLEAVEKRLAALEGQQVVTPDRLEVLRGMVRDGLTRYEGKERIIAFYTARFHARTEERLALLGRGYHNNRLEGQVIKPERYEAIRAMIKAGLSSDEICARIVGHYTERAEKEGGDMAEEKKFHVATYRDIEEKMKTAPKPTAEEQAAFEREALEALRVIPKAPQNEDKPDKP